MSPVLAGLLELNKNTSEVIVKLEWMVSIAEG
jgi:hypothetical protein